MRRVGLPANQYAINVGNITNGFFVSLNPHSEAAQVVWDCVRFESGENAVTVDRELSHLRLVRRSLERTPAHLLVTGRPSASCWPPVFIWGILSPVRRS